MASANSTSNPFPPAPRGSVDLSRYRFWVVPHTHWDREWYRTFESFRAEMIGVVDEVIDTLEADERMCFTLDGQAVLLEDYAEVAAPGQRARLEALVAAGRIAVGPSYVLPDGFLIGAETHVRNLLLGRKVCRGFGGEPMAAGYLPDTFGHIAQLPQILRGFGLDNILFQRGLGDETAEVGSAFTWVGPDGSEVCACVIFDRHGYGAAQRLGRWSEHGTGHDHDDPEPTGERAAERIREIVEDNVGRLVQAGDQRDVLICNGADHLPIQPELPALVDHCRDALGAEFHICTYADFVAAWRARFAAPARVHGELVGGLEHQVTRGVNSTRMYLKQGLAEAERELLAAEMLTAFAWLQDPAYEHPGATIEAGWKELLKNTAHDSICGCSIDEVHRDMLPRFATARAAAAIARESALHVVDLLPVATVSPGRSVDARTIANDHVRVAVAPDGTLTFTDHESGTTHAGLLQLRDVADIGDEYNFGALPGDVPVVGYHVPPDISSEDGSLTIIGELELPEQLAPDRDARVGVVRVPVTMVVQLDGATVHCMLSVDNTARDHRLALLFPTSGAAADGVRSEGHFHVNHRPATIDWGSHWFEPPQPTHHTSGWVAAGNLAVRGDGLPEYESLVEGDRVTIALTLLRCVGWLSRDDFAERPFNAGPYVPTPDAQCLGAHDFHVSFGVQHPRAPLARNGVLDLEGAGWALSSIKLAESGDAVIVRVHDAMGDGGLITVSGSGVGVVERVRLDETHPEPVTPGSIDIGPWEILTLRVVPPGRAG